MVRQGTDFVAHVYSTRKSLAMGRSKDTSDINKTTDNASLKSCILIPSPDGSGEKINMKKAKSVHFADSLGKPLKSVKTLHDDFGDEFDFGFLSLCPTSKSRRSFIVPQDVFTKNKRNSTLTNVFKDKKISRLVNFSQPCNNINFPENVRTKNVSLENVIFREHGIFATVAVHNIAFEKNVSVNYTFDNWVNVLKTEAKYVLGSTAGTIDTFSFEINIAEEKDRDNKEFTIKFAICYTASGSSYWDSNDGKNYEVIFKKEKPDKRFISSSAYNGLVIPKQNFIGWAS